VTVAPALPYGVSPAIDAALDAAIGPSSLAQVFVGAADATLLGEDAAPDAAWKAAAKTDLEYDLTVWVTKEGVEVPIVDLADGHLLNCVRLVERNYQAALRTVREWCDHAPESTLWPTMHQRLLLGGPTEYLPKYVTLVAEVRRRGLLADLMENPANAHLAVAGGTGWALPFAQSK
jgi:hypothetical protein